MCASLSGYAHAAFLAGERDAMHVLSQMGRAPRAYKSMCDTSLFVPNYDGDDNEFDGDVDERFVVHSALYVAIGIALLVAAPAALKRTPQWRRVYPF